MITPRNPNEKYLMETFGASNFNNEDATNKTKKAYKKIYNSIASEFDSLENFLFTLNFENFVFQVIFL
jgi:hypothetical protein